MNNNREMEHVNKFFSGMKWKKHLMLAAGIVCMLLAACTSGSDKSKADDAQTVASEAVRTVFSCTQEDVAAFDACLGGTAVGNETAETQTGMTSAGDQLGTFFSDRLGTLMTDSCIADSMGKRILSQAIDLARQNGKEIIADNIVLKERSGGEASYTFTADLKTADDQKVLQTVTGTVTLVQSEGKWLVDKLTCN